MMLEYWFDDDVNARQSTSVSGTTGAVNLDVDASQLLEGLHWLNVRVRQSDGLFSPVTRSPFFKNLPTGDVTMLEYWFDGDLNTVARVPLHEASSDGIMLLTDSLNLGGVSSGMHRMYYRAVNADGTYGTAVCVAPVMVKSLYEREMVDAQVVKFAMTVDDQPVTVVNVAKPAKEVPLSRTLDMRDLSPGKHRLTIRAWNSAYASVSIDTTFTVVKSETPEVKLKAQLKKGLVKLSFNSVPNDVKWKLVRIDASGASSMVRSGNTGHYPNAITTYDNPEDGQYAYQARCFYTDAEGNQKYVTSNKVTVTVTGADQQKYGYVNGVIRAQDSPTPSHSWVAKFVEDNVSVPADAYGTFLRDRIPVGTKLTITATDLNDEAFTFDKKTITVKEGRNDVVITGHLDVDMMRYSHDSDLEFASNMEFTPGRYFKVKVRNISCRQWRGKLRLVAVRKADFEQSLAGNGLAPGSYGAGTVADVAPFTQQNIYVNSYSDELNFASSAPQEVYIKQELSRGDQNEEYYFFVYSVENSGAEKLVGVNTEYNIKQNPFMQLVEMNKVDESQQQSTEEQIEYAVDLVMSMMNGMKEFDDMLGELDEGNYFKTDGLHTDAVNYITNATSMQDLMRKYARSYFMQKAYDYSPYLQGVAQGLRESIADYMRIQDNLLTGLKGVKSCLNAIEDYNSWQSMTDLERAGYVARKVLELAVGGDPFAKAVLKIYLDMTEKTIQNIYLLGERYYSHLGYEMFEDDGIRYKIRVKRSGWFKTAFDGSEVKDRILSAEVTATNSSPEATKAVATVTFDPEVNSRGDCYLKWKSITGNLPLKRRDSGFYLYEKPIEDMWMTIYWSSGRVSRVPLRVGKEVQGNGVKYTGGAGPEYLITFQSGADKAYYMSDIIHLDD